MKHGTHCKFCHMPITLQISDDYKADPAKLIARACCNRCADFRNDRATLEETMTKTCLVFHRSSETARNKMRENVLHTLETLSKKYTRLIADWHHLTPEWDQTIVDRLISNPERVLILLSSLWPDTRTSDSQPF